MSRSFAPFEFLNGSRATRLFRERAEWKRWKIPKHVEPWRYVLERIEAFNNNPDEGLEYSDVDMVIFLNLLVAYGRCVKERGGPHWFGRLADEFRDDGLSMAFLKLLTRIFIGHTNRNYRSLQNMFLKGLTYKLPNGRLADTVQQILASPI